MVFGNNRINIILFLRRKFLVTFLFFFLIHLSFAEDVKEPNVAGAFYPSDKKELLTMIQGFVSAAGSRDINGEPVFLIAPHAGYIYSGPVAAYGFAPLTGKSYDSVVILAPSHFFYFYGAAVYSRGAFRTPLGEIKVDQELASELLNLDARLLSQEKEYFQQEHALEVELPFLQAVLEPGFEILPVILGNMTYSDCVLLAEYLAQISEGKSILVVSSTDLSHYKTYDEALVYDKKTVDFVKNQDALGLWNSVAGTGWNVCGIRPVVTGLNYAKIKGATRLEVLKYANSGDTAGGKDRVVGYMSALFSKDNNKREESKNSGGEEGMLTKEERKRLLEIARQSISSHIKRQKMPDIIENSPALNRHNGAFVTLHKKGELRGCIGQFVSEDPLYKVVSDMSIESCSRDYRFSPVGEDELGDTSIEISVLSEPKLIDDWKKIRLGVDGVIVRKGYSSGVFLPQVATETGWDLETFLGQLCAQKAGLPWDCYKDPQTKIYTFQAEVFSEQEP